MIPAKHPNREDLRFAFPWGVPGRFLEGPGKSWRVPGGGPWKVPGRLGSLEGPWVSLEVPEGSLEGPWDILTIPQGPLEIPGGPRRSLEGPWGVTGSPNVMFSNEPRRSLEVPWGPWGYQVLKINMFSNVSELHVSETACFPRKWAGRHFWCNRNVSETLCTPLFRSSRSQKPGVFQ